MKVQKLYKIKLMQAKNKKSLFFSKCAFLYTYTLAYIKSGRSSGGLFLKNFKGVPYFWVLLHFYVTISNFFQISVFLRGGQRGDTSLQRGGLSPLSPSWFNICFPATEICLFVFWFHLNFPLCKFSIQEFKKSGISKWFFLFLTLSYITLSLTFCSFMPAMPTTRIFNWVLRCSFMYIAAAEILRVCRCISMFEIVWFRKYVCKHDPLFIQRGTTD